MRNIIALKRRRQTNIYANRSINWSLSKVGVLLLLVSIFCCVGGVEAFLSGSGSGSARSSRRNVAFAKSSSSSSSIRRMSDDTNHQTQRSEGMEEIARAAKDMNDRAKGPLPFTEEELDMILTSMQNIAPPPNDQLDWKNIRQLFSDVAHLSHKDWDRTGESASRLRHLLLRNNNNNNDDDDDENENKKKDEGLSMSEFQSMFQRIMTEGNWYGAAKHTSSSTTTTTATDSTSKPWVVLVTGVNGIRKTTSVYQSWFPQLLEEALVSPPSNTNTNNHNHNHTTLPTGDNSFFRQLDHMIISLTNEDFKRLYQLTSQILTTTPSSSSNNKQEEGEDGISQSVVDAYSDFKAAIFTRFRTLSEILGVLLVREAQKDKLNVMIETSGRDIAMFHYVDTYFPSEHYHKLALHFVVDDLSHAKRSVDQRMVREIKDGTQAQTVQQIIHANAGGPYGSSVLPGVQADSDRVWDQVVMTGGVEPDWYKASIRIEGHATQPWTARAILPNGSQSDTTHTFTPPPHLQPPPKQQQQQK